MQTDTYLARWISTYAAYQAVSDHFVFAVKAEDEVNADKWDACLTMMLELWQKTGVLETPEETAQLIEAYGVRFSAMNETIRLRIAGECWDNDEALKLAAQLDSAA